MRFFGFNFPVKASIKTVTLLIAITLLSSLPTQAQRSEPATPTPITPTRGPTLTPSITPTPTPSVSPLIDRWFEEVVYPQAVYFELTFRRPISQIALITLTIETANRDPWIIDDATLRSAMTGGPSFTDVRFFWYLPPENLPPYGAVARYNWNIVTDRGEVADAPGVFAYLDPSTPWTLDDDPAERFDFFYPADTLDIDLLRDGLNPIYDLLASATGQQITLRLAFYNDTYPLERCITEGGQRLAISPIGRRADCQTPVIEAVLNRMGYTVIDLPAFDTPFTFNFMARRLINAFYRAGWQQNAIPDWFSEGLIALLIPGDKSGLIEQLRGAARIQQLLPLDAMTTRQPQSGIWDAQAYSMVLYLARQLGIAELLAFSNSAAAFEDDFAAAVGFPLSTFFTRWQTWIFTDAALADANFALYGEPTPFPSPTLTRTPFPPSPTPTFTATPTDTPTATVTGFLSATPLPTLTPSDTPLPVTPSVTPRRFSAFQEFSPTPFPVSTPAPSTDSASIDPRLIVIGAALALLSLIGAALFSSRKRTPSP